MTVDIRKRAGVVVKSENGEVLVIRRVRGDGPEYYCLPGGGIENGETAEQAAVREAAEELSLSVTLGKELARLTTKEGREEIYFLVEQFSGEPALGGEEKERMNESNQYYLEWKNKDVLLDTEPFYPAGMKQKVLSVLN